MMILRIMRSLYERVSGWRLSSVTTTLVVDQIEERTTAEACSMSGQKSENREPHDNFEALVD